MMRMDKMTLKTQEAFEAAQSLMSRYSHQQMEGEHVLWGLLQQAEGVVPQILQKLEVDPARLKKQVEAALERLPRVHGAGGIYLSKGLSDIIDAAWKEAERLKDEYLSTEHLYIVFKIYFYVLLVHPGQFRLNQDCFRSVLNIYRKAEALFKSSLRRL
jgi:ATP-dependent Clp protease ATP-binding subunit ClpB